MADSKNDPRAPHENVPPLLREAWLSILGVFTQAEAEVSKATNKLFESLGVPADEKGEHHLAAEFMARVKKNREDIERRIDEGVKAAVARVRAPIDKEIATIKSRVEKLQAKLDKRPKKDGE